ncbi:DUF5105 domain-containing protein [Ruminococcaceae bacterium OttesenSCG-928-L11]|nr:DUF5105 domain-containing protein [Ruminococcaceae bacterium OttesenSCG-928-L11]
MSAGKLVTILICFSLLFTFTSCTNQHTQPESLQAANQQQSDSEEILTPSKTVITAFDALKNADTKTFNQFIQHTAGKDNTHVENKLLDDSLDSEGQEFVKAVMENFSYDIGEETIQGDTATVQVDFTNSDLSNVMGELISRAMQEQQETEDGKLNGIIIEASGGESVTESVELSLVKKGGIWKITLDDADMNAICGGLFTNNYEYD